jgi:hypothetical protein
MAGAGQKPPMTIVTESARRTTSALDAYFRCRLDATITVGGDLSARPGFFTFGGAVCYGRVAGVVPATEAGVDLPDVTSLARVEPGTLTLPFDVDEVADSLRFERYCSGAGHEGLGSSSAVRSIYYLLRPLLPVGVRKHLQRIKLRDWERIPFPAWPVDSSVDRIVFRVLELAIESADVGEVPFIWFWPDGASGAAIVTHDVETPAGLAFCDQLMDLDDEANLKASFQLVPEVRYQTTAAAFDRLRQRGFEGNIHDLNHDGHLFDSHNQFAARSVKINDYARQFSARGFRAACMYRNQEWLPTLAVGYDMSVPNVAHMEPQRGGCCTVLPYFVGGLVELPLTLVQDYSLFNILCDYSTDLWQKQIDAILDNYGLITILSHPDYLMQPETRAVYRDLLALVRRVCDERQVWHALPGDVERWWRQRAAMTLVRRGGSWAIEGEGSDRARVAYASAKNGRLRFLLKPSGISTGR